MRYLILFITLLTIFNCRVLAATKDVTLQLQWLHQFQFAGYYMAKEKGFYAKKGLHVKIKELTKNTHVVNEVISKKSDFGVCRSSLILDHLQGKTVVALAAILQSSSFDQP